MNYRLSPWRDYSARAMVVMLHDEVVSTFKHYRVIRDIAEFQHYAEIERHKLELLFDILAAGRTGDEGAESVYHQARDRAWKEYWKPEVA